MLQNRRVVVAEMIVSALPQIGVRRSGNLYLVRLYEISGRDPGPLHVFKSHSWFFQWCLFPDKGIIKLLIITDETLNLHMKIIFLS